LSDFFWCDDKRLGPVWNKGIENTGIVENGGIGKESGCKTADWKTHVFYMNRCLERRNMTSIGILELATNSIV
jgi:hypothetical protein